MDKVKVWMPNSVPDITTTITIGDMSVTDIELQDWLEGGEQPSQTVDILERTNQHWSDRYKTGPYRIRDKWGRHIYGPYD